MKRPRLALAVLGVVGVLALVIVASSLLRGRDVAPLVDGPPVFAQGTDRVTVEVLNTTDTRGLARRATMVLRSAGLDVVRYGSDGPALDSTIVLDRSGHPDRARRVARALGVGRVDSRLDTTLYLDVTVRLGRDWRPPAEPFRP